MGELHAGKGGTLFYDPPKAVPVLGMASDGGHIFLTGGGGGATASKEVPNQVQVHRYNEASRKISTIATLNTEKSVVVHLSHSLASGLWLACTQARCMVLEFAEDAGELTQVCEWTTESAGRAPEANVARCAPSGELAATGGTDGVVRIWRFSKVREAPELQQTCAKNQEVLDLDFTPDGTIVASCDRSGPCRLWDTATGEEKFTLQYLKAGKLLTVRAVRCVMHLERAMPVLVLGANSGPRDPSYIGVFTMDGSLLEEVKVDKLPLTAMAVDVRGQWAACTLASGGKKVFSLPRLQLLAVAKEVHDLPAPATAFVADAALSAGGDRTINILSLSHAGDGGGGSSALLYMCFFLLVLLAVVYLAASLGLKGAALQQGSNVTEEL